MATLKPQHKFNYTHTHTCIYLCVYVQCTAHADEADWADVAAVGAAGAAVCVARITIPSILVAIPAALCATVLSSNFAVNCSGSPSEPRMSNNSCWCMQQQQKHLQHFWQWAAGGTWFSLSFPLFLSLSLWLSFEWRQQRFGRKTNCSI